jgi:hypothetical protein
MKISGDPAKLSAVFGRGSFIDRSFHLLSDYRDHFAAGTARTGHCAPRSTCPVVLPRTDRQSPDGPVSRVP